MPGCHVGVDFHVELRALLECAIDRLYGELCVIPHALNPGAAVRHETPATENVAAAPTNFLTAAEVALRLRVSRSTVYNLIASGRLAAHCNGGGKVRPRGLRVPEEAVAEYLNGSRISPSQVA